MAKVDYCIVLLAIAVAPSMVLAITDEICEQKGEYITCPFGKVINVISVQYGRTRLGFCNPYNVPNLPTNCRSTSISTNMVVKICQTRGSCFLEADNTILGEDPCPNFPKYLTVDYTCVYPTTTTKKTTTRRTTPTTTPTTTTRRTTTPTTTRRTTTPTTTRRTTTPTTTRPTTTPTTTRPTTTPSPVVPFAPFNAPPGSQTCHDYLVSGQKNRVPDDHLTASSEYGYGDAYNNHSPARARLFSDAGTLPNGTYNAGAWASDVNNQQQYIQVQLNTPSIVRGVATQGRHLDQGLCCYQYTKKYRLMYSLDCVNFDTVKDKNGNDMIFNGNGDQDSVVTNMLDCPIMARCIRINPLEWKDHVSLRFDLLGCPAQTGDLGHCPNGWEQRPGSNDCYLITDVTDMRTRDDASAECQKQQGHLVKVDSIAERIWLQQKVAYLQQTQGQYHFWTGLSNRPRTDSSGYRWSDHSPLDTNIMPWRAGQPDDAGGSEHCGELWEGEMNDNDCNQNYPYICEQPKFWTPPRNIPKPNAPVPTRLTTTRGTTTVKRAPPTVKPYQRPLLPGSKVVNGVIYSAGCLGQSADCAVRQPGDYQSCQGCHYYMTCAPSGVFTRPCPANLVWDDNLHTCSALSSTCGPYSG